MKVNIEEYKDDNTPRVVDVVVESFDLYNADNTIGLIIHPILVAYKDKCTSVFYVDDEDVPDELKTGGTDSDFKDFDAGKRKQDWVIDEMIYAFECLGPNSDWEGKYYNFKDGYDTAPFEKMHLFYEVDEEGLEAAEKRLNNGLRLFGRYCRGLWL